uniref:Uncharacterized protein n=1 Tax=Rhizophora mucronata TaxID=61149 RepID=A0A2P2KQF9_RHIMU
MTIIFGQLTGTHMFRKSARQYYSWCTWMLMCSSWAFYVSSD